jgi:hypothetical protein
MVLSFNSIILTNLVIKLEKDVLPIDPIEGKLMKSFFSLKQNLDELSMLSPVILSNTSVQELYQVLIQFIEFVRFARVSTTVERVEAWKVPGMRAVPASYSNIGGLVKVNYPKVIIPIQPREQQLLDEISEMLVLMQNALIRGHDLPKRFFKVSIQRIGLKDHDATERGGNKTMSKAERKKRNRHFHRLRKNR